MSSEVGVEARAGELTEELISYAKEIATEYIAIADRNIETYDNVINDPTSSDEAKSLARMAKEKELAARAKWIEEKNENIEYNVATFQAIAAIAHASLEQNVSSLQRSPFPHSHPSSVGMHTRVTIVKQPYNHK